MKKYYSIFFILLSYFSFSQNRDKDFIVTHDNDTIYGVIYMNGLTGKNGKWYKIKDDYIKTFRYRNKVYQLEKVVYESIFSKETEIGKGEISSDSIINLNKGLILFNNKKWMYVNRRKKSSDYIVTNKNDTIYGVIKKPKIGKAFLTSHKGIKYVINKRIANSYEFRGEIFHKKKVHSIGYPGKTTQFIKLLVKGRLTLYEYNEQWGDGIETRHYIEKNKKLKYISSRRFTLSMMSLISDNKELAKRLKNRETGYGNLYYLVKEYNNLN